MAEKNPKKPTEKPEQDVGGDQQNNVKSALADVVGIISRQVSRLKETADKGALGVEDARLLSMYARALVNISNEERHQAAMISHDLGMVDNDDLDELEREAKKVLGKS